MGKKLLILILAAVMMFGVFGLTGCGDKVNKIDIGGKIRKEAMPATAVRIMLDKDIFHCDDEITLKLGFGFISEQSVPRFTELGAVVVFKIAATGFIIEDEREVKSDNGYEKEFEEYSDSKFLCTLNNKRYIPNYYEVFRIELISDTQNDSGTIIISSTLYYRDGGYSGIIERIYYAASSDKIAFSAISVKNAQKKLK